MTAPVQRRTSDRHPSGYVRPPAPLVVELRDVIGFQASCVACRGRMVVEPPSLDPGRVYCLACDREMAEVVERLPVRIDRAAFAAMVATPRGRPFGSKNGACERCGHCSSCRTRQWRERQKAGAPWSKDYPACVICGQTDSEHHGYGRCNRCRFRALYSEAV